MSLGHIIFRRLTKHTFISMGKLKHTIVEFGQRKTLTLSRNKLYILKNSQHGVVLRLLLSLDRIFLRDKCTLNQNLFRRIQWYRDMLKDFVIPQFQQRRCLQDIIFMNHGIVTLASCKVIAMKAFHISTDV